MIGKNTMYFFATAALVLLLYAIDGARVKDFILAEEAEFRFNTIYLLEKKIYTLRI